MEVSGTPVPDIRSGFYSRDTDFSEAYEDDTQIVIHFYASKVHHVIETAIQNVIRSPVATRAGFICSSDVVFTNSQRASIDLTGTVVSNVRFIAQPNFRMLPLGSAESESVDPKDVKLIILFGSRDWNEEARGRLLPIGVNSSFLRNLTGDQEASLLRLKHVPIIGGEPVHGQYSASPRGFIAVGSMFECHSILVDNSENGYEQFYELRKKVEESASQFVRPELVGFVFGALGTVNPHSRHYMTAEMWSFLKCQFPHIQFTGCSTLSVFMGNYPHKSVGSGTLVSIVIVEK